MANPELSPHALASLVAISDHGSLSAAARFRNLTQPSLSRQVQDLEARMGVQLVERGAHGARLTPAGDALAEGAREILASLAALPQRVRALQGEVSGRVRLGTVESIGIYVLPKLLAEFKVENPDVDVQVTCQSSPQLNALLLTDELDIVIGTMDNPKVSSELLYQDRLVLTHPVDMPTDKLPESISDLAHSRLLTFPAPLTVRKLLDQACDRAGITISPIMELANVEALKAMVRAGLGLAVIPDGCIDGSDQTLDSVYLEGLDTFRSIRMLYREQNSSLATQKIMEALRTLRGH